MINALIKNTVKNTLNFTVNFTKDYIDLTLSEPVEVIKKRYKPKNSRINLAKTNKFSINQYIKKQNQMTSPKTSYDFKDVKELRQRRKAEIKLLEHNPTIH